jgi:AcrR family transcriptional regulator
MRRDTRRRILQCAKELFNARGYNAVSTRDIANAAGIGKGNLTYYFRRKEEIAEAILCESLGFPPPGTPRNLEELDAFFLGIQHFAQENAFYFWHHTQLSQLSDKIRERQRAIYRVNTEKLTQALQALLADGVIREESYAGEYGFVIDTLLLSGIYWTPFCGLRQEGVPEALYRQQAWSVLYPLLTDKGRLLREAAGA